MRLKSLALACTLAAAPVYAADITVPGGTYELKPTHSSLHWKVKHFGISNYFAGFTGISATLELDAAEPTNSQLTASVKTASVDTGFPWPEEDSWDAELAGPDWFNSAEFPTADFKATNLELTGDNTGQMTGDMTFMGVTKPVTFEVELVGQLPERKHADGAVIGFAGTARFNRSDFGLDQLIPVASDEVMLFINAEFHQVVSE
ncbi:YceI family protein [Ruegeria sp.]|uniref:YceI family protein n=1 Tax=Ruegeria sp. TaxID=1879320 RepID=UPI0023271053|nr:YceI family protein [Ruegeria sp.]MDA7963485.1 YceI family protein [Ruegeria sp.]